MKQSKINEMGFKERKMKRLNEHGITLVALVVTIIIMLILAGVAIRLALGENGLLTMSRNATGKYKQAQTNEATEMNTISDQLDDLSNGVRPKIEIDNQVIKLSKDNVAKYLGKVVTNYKSIEENNTEIGYEDSRYYSLPVATKYRLYYVDFNNKYGDGFGTVYLKADNTTIVTGRQQMPLFMTGTESTSKIKNLNPSLYKDENGNAIESPNSNNENMKAVTWLLDTSVWNKLVETGVDTEIGDKVNYVVGAPSLEMMIDSYNTHYNLMEQGNILVPFPSSYNAIKNGKRAKLFYKYLPNNYGYQVGYGVSNSVYYTDWGTSNYTVQKDSEISDFYDMYYGNYWIGSPLNEDNYAVAYMDNNSGGYINRLYTNKNMGYYCPLVSLKSDVQLKLAN